MNEPTPGEIRSSGVVAFGGGVPELPEAEICRRQLGLWSEGRRLGGVELPDPAVVRHKLSSRPSDAHPKGAQVLEAWVGRRSGPTRRHGKRVGWEFGADALVIHLGMTGRWVRRSAQEGPPPHARIGLDFGESVLWMLDTRRFGCVVPVAAAGLADRLRDGHGPDALEEPLDGEGLQGVLNTRKPVKVALMDQGRLAGLGNIHAAEACFRAGVAPGRPPSDLDDADFVRLAQEIVAQLRATVDGVEPANEMVYVSEGGDNPFAVYGREGHLCPRCSGTVMAEVMGGRTTFWCPGCQR